MKSRVLGSTAMTRRSSRGFRADVPADAGGLIVPVERLASQAIGSSKPSSARRRVVVPSSESSPQRNTMNAREPQVTSPTASAIAKYLKDSYHAIQNSREASTLSA